MKIGFLATCLLVVVTLHRAEGERRIAFGTNSTKPPNNIPFMAQIRFGADGKDYGKLECGGSIIATRTVLSAAHCFCYFQQYPASYRVSVGTDLLDTYDDHRFLYKIEQVFIQPDNHSQHLPCQMNIDVALVKISGKMTFNEFIKPIKLEKEFQSSMDLIMKLHGWGLTENGEFPLRLKKLDRLYQVDIKICIDSWLPNYVKYLAFISHICFESQFRNSAHPSQAKLHRACNGDSGGPVTITRYNGEEVQIGVFVAGSQKICGSPPDRPDLAVRISAIYNWIMRTKNIIER